MDQTKIERKIRASLATGVTAQQPKYATAYDWLHRDARTRASGFLNAYPSGTGGCQESS